MRLPASAGVQWLAGVRHKSARCRPRPRNDSQIRPTRPSARKRPRRQPVSHGAQAYGCAGLAVGRRRAGRWTSGFLDSAEQIVPATSLRAVSSADSRRHANASVRPGPGGAKDRTRSRCARFSTGKASDGSRVTLEPVPTICTSVARLVARKLISLAPRGSQRVHA